MKSILALMPVVLPDEEVANIEHSPGWASRPHVRSKNHTPELRFRVLLAGGIPEVELALT